MRTKVAVTVDISRRREVSMRPVTRDGEGGDLRIGDSGEETEARGLETL